ncbi:MAG: hypothetical protein IAG13_23520 [Deltaproteobacteria bacterium]|nr:hypothetical protein [Nannocystaceae bacterium]
MDPLRADDIARARAASPAQKLMQALEMMGTGFELKRASLRTRFPLATEEEIADMFSKWLAYDE